MSIPDLCQACHKYLHTTVVKACPFCRDVHFPEQVSPVSPIFKAVREKRCKAWYTLAKRSPTAPESALARDSEPSNGDTRGGPPEPPSASPLETLRVTARLLGEPFPVWHSRHTDRLTSPLEPPTDAAP